MIAVFISAPENIRSLEKYKTIQSRLADPRKVPTDAERDELVRQGKTVVVISCSILPQGCHFTNAVQLAAGLASQNDQDTLSILSHDWGADPSQSGRREVVAALSRKPGNSWKAASRRASIITMPAMTTIATGS
jgi:hypothetical protein